MLVRDGDPASPSNYVGIRGDLKGVGRRVQVYVAAEDVEQVSGDLVRDLIVTFDDQIYPVSARRVGTARDVDGDGRFTILLSSWLDHLGSGRTLSTASSEWPTSIRLTVPPLATAAT